ncbi:Protein of unknown function, partial [Gryllus bimaculatus]
MKGYTSWAIALSVSALARSILFHMGHTCAVSTAAKVVHISCVRMGYVIYVPETRCSSSPHNVPEPSFSVTTDELKYKMQTEVQCTTLPLVY